MKRRTYLGILGSVAGVGAATMSTSAAVDIWRTTDAGVSVVSDSDGLIGFSEGEENGAFADVSGGSLSIDISTGQAKGLNADTRTVIDDIFRIRNQSNDAQVIWIKDTLDDQSDLFGDEGPLHFFRGPVSTTNDSGNGVLGARRRIFSQLDPVPGTPDSKQRLTIVGLVPPKANIGTKPGDARLSWINNGHPVTVVKGGTPAISDTDRRAVGDGTDLSNVSFDENVVAGNEKGRFFFTPGEEMKVGLAADFSGFDGTSDDFELGQVLSEIEIVSRSLEDARNLATGNTEFNPI